ncbi:hypothetical protein [Serratia fonticola]|uniref:hypothetical protein n=1 Tax=Serratia fonticola TaxID=47917 RepID=UPI001376D1DF|nr:hypothetical protein [Serratia fonticola]NCG50247.1 hypothetical protein [Serratia fonticola]
MALSEREKSLIEVIGKSVKEELDERERQHAVTIAAMDQRIKRLEDDIEGLLDMTE